MTFSRFLTAVRSVAVTSRALYWGRCPHCEQTTAWQTNALRGTYRCTTCGHSTLDA